MLDYFIEEVMVDYKEPDRSLCGKKKKTKDDDIFVTEIGIPKIKYMLSFCEELHY